MSYNTTTINLEKELRHLGPWHFLIELEPGVFTIPREQWKTLWHSIVVQDYITRTLFPLMDMLNEGEKSNTTVIDIGCNEGWLALLLHRLGYKRVVGVDSNEENIKKANFLKEHFNMKNVEFHCTDVNNFRTEERFDFSIMLGVINHTHNPVGVLQNIYDFTAKYLILDFDSLCGDYYENSPEAKFETGLSSVSGNMRCHFERAHQVTSTEDNNLVFQYSKRAMLMMMNYAGFSDVLQVLPKISTPAHYKNEKRVFLAGKKHPNKKYYEHEIMLDQEYAEACSCFNHSLPVLKEEGYKGFNIVQCGDEYYGIPQGAMEEFDIITVVNDERCVFGDSIDKVRELINTYLATRKNNCGDLERDKLKHKVGCELILQSKIAEAKRLFEDLKQRHGHPVTELTADIFYQLGRIAKRAGNVTEAKECWTRCISINPKLKKAHLRLWELEHNETLPVSCHEIFR